MAFFNLNSAPKTLNIQSDTKTVGSIIGNKITNLFIKLRITIEGIQIGVNQLLDNI